MTALDLDAVERRYEKALDAKPSKGPVTRWDALTDSVADVPELLAEVLQLRAEKAALLALPPTAVREGMDRLCCYTAEDIRRTIVAAGGAA